MAAKVILVCASALLVQMIAGQCIRAPSNCGCGGSNLSVAPSSGGGFQVWSTSPINPNGVYVSSENNIDGNLAVCGQIPLLSAVGLQGQLPTNGQVGVQYSCGNGNVGINSVGPSNYAASGLGYNGLSNSGLSLGNNGWSGLGNGCGCGY